MSGIIILQRLENYPLRSRISHPKENLFSFPKSANIRWSTRSVFKYFSTQKQIMKQKSLPFYLFIFLLLVVPSIYGQAIPELIFRNPVLESGTALQNGAKYRFKNAAAGVDAMVEIKQRSASNVEVRNIDLTSFGWDNAFQPELGISGTVAPYQEWWVEFEISFLKAGTNKTQKLDKFDATSLDVDGDNVSIQEFVKMEKAKKVTYSTLTNLMNGAPETKIECGECGHPSALETCSNCSGTGKNGSSNCGNCKGSGKLHEHCDHAWDGESNYAIQGPVLNFINIDTLGTAVMATYNYENKDKIKLKIGAKSGAQPSSAGMRLNSIWFKAFNLSPMGVLPVKLTGFNAKYNKQNVDLTWTTEQERTFNYFIVEKSVNGIDFKETAVVFAKDNGQIKKEYSFTDEEITANKGILYYRLKMVDASMQSQKSMIRVIKIGEVFTDVNIQAYPNPVVNELRITVPATWQNTKVTYDLYSANGTILKHVVNNNANQTETLAMTGFNPGVYVVKVNSGTETVVKQIMKSK